MTTIATDTTPGEPGYGDLFRAFGRVGVLSFGGPAAQIALMQDELVTRRRWLSEEGFLRALSFCMLLPGPEAMQLATYAGWRVRGVLGGLLAGSLFVLPGALVIFALAALYVQAGEVPALRAAFLGIQATVVVIVAQALWRLSKKALRGSRDYALAVGAFVALFAVGLPFPLVIGIAAAIGALTPGAAASKPATPTAPTPWSLLALFLVLWLAPIAILWASGATFLTEVATFFAWLAVVTFGGAYAVLAYMTQAVVQDFGWLDTAQMIDALGFAETTPGPLILVTQFVGTSAGYAEGGWGLAVAAGLLVLWVTFVPCFLWIFAGAPHLERLTGNRRIGAALKAVTAAVVGVIANLSLWFAVHVLFGSVASVPLLWAELPVPDPATLSVVALGLTAIAGSLIVWRGWPLPAVLALMAALAFGLGQV
ncbi:MAG: chromate efflux transporter [Shimia sp.]